MADWAQVGGVRLCYEVSGAGSPILLIAGLGNGREAWGLQVAALRAAFRCVTYDQRDVGDSDSSPTSYSVRDLAADAAGLIEALGMVRAHVVGWSLGGAVAQELAIGWPERVERLALLATYPAGDRRGAANLRGWAWLRRRLEPADYYRVTAPWVYSPEEYKRPGLVDRAIERAVERPPQAQAAFERQVEAAVTHAAAERLGLIQAPTLLIFGSDDALTPLRFAEMLRRGIDRAELDIVPGAGHALLWTRPDEVNAALRRFLTGGAGPPG